MHNLLLLLIVSVSVLSVSPRGQADELEKAYQKEYAYLVAEKKALQNRLTELKTSQQSVLRKIKGEIDQLQSQYLGQQNQVDRTNRLIADASRDVDFNENDSLILDTTLIQAKESLSKLDQDLDESAPTDQQLNAAITAAAEVIRKDGTVQQQAGEFFAENGKHESGTIYTIGRIARYGVSDNAAGALAPAGEGNFKIWDASTLSSAQALSENTQPESLSIFLFESPIKAIEKQEEKTFMKEVDAGGLIGMIILGLGAFGALLAIVRVILLAMFSANIQGITRKIGDTLQTGTIENALAICKRNMSSASRVIAATLRNLDKDRDHIEDIISESILSENAKIDRFATTIIVIAAVSPLLGLLGTVTGMISTFDIITEFGTGDPKLLSSGISEALVTTKYGLVVAIPMLLIGNMLTSWGTRTKNDLERAALHMINKHKTSAAHA
ncbi:biopolymer transport protein [Oleiphilus messinensis]|uniref:Biopolymer transport protein n=1 Tax=Oleiphilus messinensis TaxID=141451 RepID=A0A1Y0I4L6_9GAMM|nr:MotA/TolQ/ExbB proton channel family protein [Oleiphilus messinensis]ARU54353.1 biopolymer transport protein [Oleiphilus messinensis]